MRYEWSDCQHCSCYWPAAGGAVFQYAANTPPNITEFPAVIPFYCTNNTTIFIGTPTATLHNMDAQDFWYSSGAEANGFQLGQSLRFRSNLGAQSVLRALANNSDEYTISFWTKLGQVGQNIDCFLFQGTGPSRHPEIYINFNPAAGAMEAVPGTGDAEFSAAPRKMRDPNAWYHVVYQFSAANSNRNRLWVNGDLWYDVSNNARGIRSGGFGIGTPRVNPQPSFQGYMADWYLVEQLLEPTAFGQELATGQWVPRQTNFTSAQYGANGFHLDFHDPDNLGEDVAPTGTGHTAANNFTPSGFKLTRLVQ